MKDAVARVRSFNRTVAQRVGALDERFLGRDRSLGECRLLFEIGHEGAEVRTLRERLGLDSGYLSRLLRSLERQGLVASVPAAADRRVRLARLTDRGRQELAELDRRSDAQAASLLEPLTGSQRARLLSAMGEVELLLGVACTTIEAVDPHSADARWCLSRYYAELAERFEGGFEPDDHPGPRPAELMPPRGVFLVARVSRRPVGCGALTTLSPGTGYITRMWVAPSARGAGFGGRILAALESHAEALGHRIVRLDTNRVLHEAQALYRRHGYREVAAFNDSPCSHLWFEKELSRPKMRSAP